MTAFSASVRARTILLTLLSIPLGLALHVYSGPGEWLINNWGASVVYEVLLILLAFLVFPKRKAVIVIPVAVLLITIALEFGQLWNPPWLAAIRGTFLGAALLGTTFSWLDLPAYPVGCFVGWALLKWILPGSGSPIRRSGATSGEDE